MMMRMLDHCPYTGGECEACGSDCQKYEQEMYDMCEWAKRIDKYLFESKNPRIRVKAISVKENK